MSYIQISPGVTEPGPGAPLVFTDPICAQFAIQVSSDTGGGTVSLEVSLDGVHFVAVMNCACGQMNYDQKQRYAPIAAIRYNVLSVSGTLEIAIAAAPLGTA